ncbi:cell division control protein 45 homolog [Anabrus simplex]|uniref:cell division control protein 45 homolog n=1 Tax=Anabrus simplex TaxID=316456 RepID=UPI0035A3A9BD
MYINDIRNDFYKLLIGKRVLLLVNYDIDAICACKILQSILKTDHIVYTLVPVRGIEELKTAYRENSDQVKYVIFINCGGTVDVVDLLEPEDDVVFFILDSHRPTDVCNVYIPDQVRLLSERKDDENIPECKDIFKDEEVNDENDSDESSDEEDNGSEAGSEDDDEEGRQNKRRRLAEETIIKRRERRQWEEKRNQLLFTYTQYSYFGRSSAIVMFELAWKLSKDSNDLLWWAIVGATEQMLLNKIEYQQYILETGNLQNHVLRLGHQVGDDETQSVSTLKISFMKDLQLALYRHWTVESSLRYSRYSATKLRLWTLRGEKKVQELLVEMGLPLVQSRQKFNAMDLILRQEFHSKMEKMGEKFNMDRITYGSFTLQYGYRGRYCASDFVYAMLALLEFPLQDKSSADCFMDAMDCLSRLKKDVLEDGIEKAKKMLVCVFRQVQSLLEMRQVISAGPFVYVILQEGALDVHYFSHPHCLYLLAQFALGAYVTAARNKKAPSQPLIASAPMDVELGTCLVIGIPPVADESNNNFFGKAFEQAAEKINARMNMDYFDTSIVQLKTEDRTKFLDALTSLLS